MGGMKIVYYVLKLYSSKIGPIQITAEPLVTNAFVSGLLIGETTSIGKGPRASFEL